jgi:hypothetical protein
MVALVACETLLIALLALLVAGLLRSHAEILRRLGPPEADSAGRPPLPEPAVRAGARAGHDVVGTTLDDDAVKLALGDGSPPTLLAFLSSGCAVCGGFWADLRERRRPPDVPPDIRFVAVTKGPEAELPARLRELAPTAVPVVMSSAAWRDYSVPAAPYFVYVEAGRVQGEGSATGWKQIASLLRDAVDDRADATAEVDEVLSAAGIGPGDPSLYPAGREDRR